MNRKKIRKKIKIRLKNKIKREGTTVLPDTTIPPVPTVSPKCGELIGVKKEILQHNWDLDSAIGENKASITDSQQGLLEFAFKNNSIKFMEVKKQLDKFVNEASIGIDAYVKDPKNAVFPKTGITKENVDDFLKNAFNPNNSKTEKFLNDIRKQSCKGNDSCLKAMDDYLNVYLEESIAKKANLYALDRNTGRLIELKDKIKSRC